MSAQTAPPAQLDPAALDWLGAVVHQQQAQLVARWDAASLGAVVPVARAPFVSVAAGRVGDHWYYVTLGCPSTYMRDRMLENPEARLAGVRGERVPVQPVTELLNELTIRIPAREPAPPPWPALVLWDVAARWAVGEIALERDTLVPYGPIAACPDVVALGLSVDRGFLLPVKSPFGLIKPLQLVGLFASEAAVARSWDAGPILTLLARADRHMLLGPRPSILANREVAEDLGTAIAAEVDPGRALEITGLDWDLTDEHGRSAAISLSLEWCALVAALVRNRIGNSLPLRLASAGREVALQPAEATGWAVDGERLVLALARATALELAAQLAAGTSRIELAGVPLIVILP